MKKALFSLFFLSSLSIHAMPSPQYMALDNAAQFGKFIENNMTEIISSSVALAKKEDPNAGCYFLVTEKITVHNQATGRDTETPFAELEMSCGNFKCVRSVTATVKANQWGENRVLTFTLAPKIECNNQ